jgi:ribosomal protein S18 acetylase RimI-like enzyme
MYVEESDRQAVHELVKATGFFDAAEQALAVELVDETLARGVDSGYQFLFAHKENSDELLGYACFGKIPATASSYDLYWIAVAPDEQGKGLGATVLRKVETICREQGGKNMFVDTAGRKQYAPTRAFYERLGYDVAAVLDDFYADGDAKVIYARSLPQRQRTRDRKPATAKA